MRLKSNVALVLMALIATTSAYSVPAEKPANLMQDIINYAEEAAQHVEKVANLEQIIAQAQEFYESGILQAQNAAIGNAVIEGRKDQTQQQLSMAKELAPLMKSCDTSALSKSIEITLCGQQEAEQEKNKQNAIKVNTKRALMNRTDGQVNTIEKTAALAKLQKETVDDLSSKLEKASGLDYSKSYKEGVVSPEGVKAVDFSKYLMGFTGFDRTESETARAIVDAMAPLYLGTTVTDNDRMAALSSDRKDAFLTAANSNLQNAVSFRERSEDGISRSDAIDKRLVEMSNEPRGFIKFVREAPSIVTIMRQYLLLSGQNADMTIRKFETSLNMEAMLAQRLLNRIEPAKGN